MVEDRWNEGREGITGVERFGMEGFRGERVGRQED